MLGCFATESKTLLEVEAELAKLARNYTKLDLTYEGVSNWQLNP